MLPGSGYVAFPSFKMAAESGPLKPRSEAQG